MSLTTSSADLHLTRKGVQVSGLQINSPRARELASETFSRAQSGDNTTGGNALDVVLAVPGHQVTIVNKVHLALPKLRAE